MKGQDKMKKLKLKRWVKVVLFIGGLIALYSLLGNNEVINIMLFIIMALYIITFQKRKTIQIFREKKVLRFGI